MTLSKVRLQCRCGTTYFIIIFCRSQSCSYLISKSWNHPALFMSLHIVTFDVISISLTYIRLQDIPVILISTSFILRNLFHHLYINIISLIQHSYTTFPWCNLFSISFPLPCFQQHTAYLALLSFYVIYF